MRDAELWKRLKALDLDDSAATTPAARFSFKLAKVHGWTPRYTERVIEEYRRYVYLAATSSEPMCPSEDVDEARHLHLTFTRSYWEELCGRVLKCELHHDPSRGGRDELSKHARMYQATLERYASEFGSEPPRDIWPPVPERFKLAPPAAAASGPVEFGKWIFKSILAVGSLAGLIVATGGLTIDPFRLVGAKFLGVLVPALVLAAVIGRELKKA